ncbi:MAG: hypothetical protein R3F14_30610 [Polyangiaceae bacterium]
MNIVILKLPVAPMRPPCIVKFVDLLRPWFCVDWPRVNTTLKLVLFATPPALTRSKA